MYQNLLGSFSFGTSGSNTLTTDISQYDCLLFFIPGDGGISAVICRSHNPGGPNSSGYYKIVKSSIAASNAADGGGYATVFLVKPDWDNNDKVFITNVTNGLWKQSSISIYGIS